MYLCTCGSCWYNKELNWINLAESKFATENAGQLTGKSLGSASTILYSSNMIKWSKPVTAWRFKYQLILCMIWGLGRVRWAIHMCRHFDPHFFYCTFWGLNPIFLGTFSHPPTPKLIFLATNPTRIRSLWPKIPFLPQYFRVQFFNWHTPHWFSNKSTHQGYEECCAKSMYQGQGQLPDK